MRARTGLAALSSATMIGATATAVAGAPDALSVADIHLAGDPGAVCPEAAR